MKLRKTLVGVAPAFAPGRGLKPDEAEFFTTYRTPILILTRIRRHVFASLRQAGGLETGRAIQDTALLELDGTRSFSSHTIHCPNGSCLESKDGPKTYHHRALTPVLVTPGHRQAVPLPPEFITPQDGHTQQDCPIAPSQGRRPHCPSNIPQPSQSSQPGTSSRHALGRL